MFSFERHWIMTMSYGPRQSTLFDVVTIITIVKYLIIGQKRVIFLFSRISYSTKIGYLFYISVGTSNFYNPIKLIFLEYSGGLNPKPHQGWIDP